MGRPHSLNTQTHARTHTYKHIKPHHATFVVETKDEEINALRRQEKLVRGEKDRLAAKVKPRKLFATNAELVDVHSIGGLVTIVRRLLQSAQHVRLAYSLLHKIMRDKWRYKNERLKKGYCISSYDR
jgi:hypothetical protein